MSVINDLSGKTMKHFALDAQTNARYVIVALDNPNIPGTSLVVDIDLLDGDTRSELLALVESDECQFLESIQDVLNRRFFMSYPNAPMFTILNAKKAMKAVNQQQVMVQVRNNANMSADQLLKGIKEYKSAKANNALPTNATTATALNIEQENKNAKDIEALNTKVELLTDSIQALLDKLSK